MTNTEIAKIERHQRDINKEINKLQKELLFCKNSLEVKIMSDRIFDKRVSCPVIFNLSCKLKGIQHPVKHLKVFVNISSITINLSFHIHELLN